MRLRDTVGGDILWLGVKLNVDRISASFSWAGLENGVKLLENGQEFMLMCYG